ncbi:acetolactate synthase large subunit [Corticibacter populi]|uniref:Acetolactate synthase large subunit n=1 Tax=Corticibacter populi TaxID=1550736 RepID=A0A3M6QY76_9BURK|nr:acetolactate synthase large subunit [Corticibacter populi]RMX07954.1 acetolactate synthase large subunit [Corticibacter populi]RZS35195.1 acetolactate synthase-1/2/3 large subunit [Corticibacter populi]
MTHRTGAEQLVHTLLDNKVDVCFANPGTSEMHFVAALDKVGAMRCVLGLHETVVTGAADGYYRMADKPAATLLHLGPGLANGLSNLHNAKKARSGIVNIVGDHSAEHLKLDAPLTSDIKALAGVVSQWVHTSQSASDIATDGAQAVRQACGRPGAIATLILPADVAWSELAAEGSAAVAPQAPKAAAEPAGAAGAHDMARIVQALREDPEHTLILCGDRATRADCTSLVGRIVAATGCAARAEFYGARLERGAGRVALLRLPYAVAPSLAILAKFSTVVLVGAKEPVAFFAYPDKPGRLTAPGCRFLTLSTPEDCPRDALRELCGALGAQSLPAALLARHATDAPAQGPLDSESIGRVLGATLPDNAIVVDEAISTGRGFDALTLHAAPHDWLTGCGGSIGFALPAAVGAAIAAPGRRVVALEGDGSGMYTLQSLWSMAREQLDVTVLIFANRTYGILHGELAAVGAGAPGARAQDMLNLDRPQIDWSGLAESMGVPAIKVADIESLSKALQASYRRHGPMLLEVLL